MGLYGSKITCIISVSHSFLSQIRKEEYSALEQKALQRDVTQFAVFVLLYMIKDNYLHRSKSYHVALSGLFSQPWELLCVDVTQFTAPWAGFKSQFEPLLSAILIKYKKRDQYPIAPSR